MTRIVQALEADRLVRRERDAQDGRIHRLRATAKGRRVMQRGRQRRIENLAGLLARLSPDEVARVREAADLVERALAQQA
jgi:DNA-binding MarR family transcriptional regulator